MFCSWLEQCGKTYKNRQRKEQQPPPQIHKVRMYNPSYAHSTKLEFLPAATKLGQGNIFTSVCLSTVGGEGCLPQCMLGYPPRSRPPGADPPWEQTPPEQTPPDQAPPREQTPPTRHTPPGSDPPQARHTPSPPNQPPPGADPPPPGPGTPPPREADCSIRLTSGQYASYWNAFLLHYDAYGLI